MRPAVMIIEELVLRVQIQFREEKKKKKKKGLPKYKVLSAKSCTSVI